MHKLVSRLKEKPFRSKLCIRGCSRGSRIPIVSAHNLNQLMRAAFLTLLLYPSHGICAAYDA